MELLFSFATVILKKCLLKTKTVILGTKKMLHSDMKLLINEKNHVTWNAERRCFLSAEAAER